VPTAASPHARPVTDDREGEVLPTMGGGGAEEPLDKEDEEAEVGRSRSEGGGSGGRT
jgi:hypothetical protein